MLRPSGDHKEKHSKKAVQTAAHPESAVEGPPARKFEACLLTLHTAFDLS